MKMTFSKNAFEIPDGKYLAKFLGTTMREQTGQTDPKGRPLPPPMTWDFEVVEGDHLGKKLDRMTGRDPTPKSACGKFLAAVSDRVLKDGDEIDLNAYVGKLYRVTVQENRISDNPAPVRVYEDQPAANGGNGPPRPPGKPPAPPAKTEPKFWVAIEEGKDPVLMTHTEACQAVFTKGKDPATVMVCRDGADTWETAQDAGIKGAF